MLWEVVRNDEYVLKLKGPLTGSGNLSSRTGILLFYNSRYTASKTRALALPAAM